MYDINDATTDLNNDLVKITRWAFQWKMSFNPDICKQAHEVIFSRKKAISFHPSLNFNKIPVAQTISQKLLVLILDRKLNFEEHLSKVFSKINKTIGVIRKLYNVLPRSALLYLHRKIESFLYNAALAITGAIRGSSTEKIYHELGLESLKHRRWYRKLCFLYKILKD